MAMRLAALVAGLPGVRIVDPGRAGAADEIVVGWVGGDSRGTEPGELFVARAPRPGDAAAHAIDAAARGAAAVLLPPLPEDLAARVAAAAPAVARLEADRPTEAGAQLAERMAGDPSRRLDLLAVTGTNGKTTTTWLARGLLGGDDPASPVGLIGTVTVHDGLGVHDARLTTPDPFELSPLLARMVDHGCRAAVMEASSHGLDQGRLSGVRIAAAVFTNLTQDHLDYHGTMEAYAAAKRRLFELLHPEGTAIVNVDDPRGADMIAAVRGRVVRVSAHDPSAEVLVRTLASDVDGTRLRLRGPWGEDEILVPLVGAYNAMNAAQAAAAAWALGRDRDAIVTGLARATAPPGRLEPVRIDAAAACPASPRVLVDYAHTDDALDNALSAVRPLLPEGGRLLVVFGCGGDRDRGKRPRMAVAAARHADVVVLTSDNPRTEDPERILDDAAAGLPRAAGPAVHRDADRGRAIAWAIGMAGPDDVVVIAGKGHEREQVVGTERRPFDDVAVARAALQARHGDAPSVETMPSRGPAAGGGGDAAGEPPARPARPETAR